MLRGKVEALCSLSVDLLRFCYFFATDSLIATNVLAYTFLDSIGNSVRYIAIHCVLMYALLKNIIL